MRHLHSDELIDLAEGTRLESSAPHLQSCEACRGQLTELRAMMSAAAQAEVPEPSPLFWEHFSARVRDAVAADGGRRRGALFGLFGWSWSSVLMPLSVGGCAAVLVAAALMFNSRYMPGLTTPPSVSSATAASIADAAAPMAELADDPRFSVRQGRIDNYRELSAALDVIFSAHDRDYWVARFEGFDVPFGPVNSIPEAVEDPQVAHLGMIVPVAERSEGGIRAVRPAFTFDGERATEVNAAPRIDEDGKAIRDALSRDREAWPERMKRDTLAITA